LFQQEKAGGWPTIVLVLVSFKQALGLASKLGFNRPEEKMNSFWMDQHYLAKHSQGHYQHKKSVIQTVNMANVSYTYECL
jgi:hypothetical protein